MGTRSMTAGAALCVLTLAGCGQGGGGSPSTEAPTATAPSSATGPTTSDAHLAAALRYAPGDVTTIRFGDSTSWLKRHGFADKSPAALLKDDRFRKEVAHAGYAESDLWPYAYAMDGWGWSATDISWSATTTKTGSGPSKTVHYTRFRDDTELSAVKKSLTSHGYQPKGAQLLGPGFQDVKDPTASGIVMAIGHYARFYPGKHLLVSSNTTSKLSLPAAATSLAAQPLIRAVVASVTTANHVGVMTGDDACQAPKSSTAQEKAQRAPLGRPDAVATVVLNGTKSAATAVYPSVAAAKADLPARKSLVHQKSLINNEPYPKIADITVSRKRATLRYTIGAKAQIVEHMMQTRDAPWAMCGPKSS